MKKKFYAYSIMALLAALIWAASALAQNTPDSFDPSEDFRKSYPAEIKKQGTWQTKKSRGMGTSRQPDPSEAAPAQTSQPLPAPEPQWEEPIVYGEPAATSATPAAQQEESYSPPPPQNSYAPQPRAQESPAAYSDPADYTPPPGYYDQSNGSGRPRSQRQVPGDMDNSVLEDYRSSAPAADSYSPQTEPENYQSQAEPSQTPAPREEQPYTAPAPSNQTAQPALGMPDTSEVESHASPSAPALPPVMAPRATQRVSATAATDYSNSDSWMYLPQNPSHSVDVFFLYTGSCDRPGTCSISDPGMRQKAMETTLQQAGVFEPVGNLFVPYYRQLNSSIFLGLKPADRAGRLAVSSADAAAAFDYYLKHHNNGRPFILAGHGQGSAALLEGILSHYFAGNTAAKNQMVAAYAIGYSVTTDFLSSNSHLRIAERRNDTGVIISYCTEAPGVTSTNPVVLPRAVAINPVNWTRSERKALTSHSRGANLTAFGEEEYKEHFADARVNMTRGVVECSTADLDKYASPDYPHGAFPVGDYAFYYYDLRNNAQERIDAFGQGRP